MAKARNKRSKPPSREKYEKENPTVCARVSKGTRDRLLVNLAKLGMTLPDALKGLAGELEVKAIPVEEARQKGYKEGYEEAMKLYMVTYLCFECGKPIAITSLETKRVVSKFLTEHGWGHTKCIERMKRA
jgi:hypothetical protein